MRLKNLISPPLVSGCRTAPAAPSFFLSFPAPLVKNRRFGELDAARAEWRSARDRLLFHRGRLLPPWDCSRPTVVRLPAVPPRERLPASVRKPSRRRCLGHRLRRPQCRRLGRRRRRIGQVQRCLQGPAERLGAASPRTGVQCQRPRAAWPPQRGRRASLSSSRAWRVASSTGRCSRRN